MHNTGGQDTCAKSSGETTKGVDKRRDEHNPQVDFHGGTLIDENAREVEITESMVRQAIHELEPEAHPELKDQTVDSHTTTPAFSA